MIIMSEIINFLCEYVGFMRVTIIRIYVLTMVPKRLFFLLQTKNHYFLLVSLFLNRAFDIVNLRLVNLMPKH